GGSVLRSRSKGRPHPLSLQADGNAWQGQISRNACLRRGRLRRPVRAGVGWGSDRCARGSHRIRMSGSFSGSGTGRKPSRSPTV
ncbi:hypothetical protein AVDCRST_MAG82-2954, partial [uncultured Rubrobacteraceae bacterium]